MPASKPMQYEHDRGLHSIADELVSQICTLTICLRTSCISGPTLSTGASSELWTLQDGSIAETRDRVLNLMKRFSQLLLGPHAYFHELISSNWDLSALYTILEFDIFERIPLQGSVTASELASQVAIPERKLLNVLRLAACSNILCEAEEGVFSHTALSEELLHDKCFKAFIGFQLFETRIGGAHLADSLKIQPNTFDDGQSAFKFAFGKPLYEWHKKHDEKGSRFRMGMASVGQSLDPGTTMFTEWLRKHSSSLNAPRQVVIDLFGGNAMAQDSLAEKLPHLQFQSAKTLEDVRVPRPADPILAYTVRNIFWNKTDLEVVESLKAVAGLLERTSQAALLVNEMLSPAKDEFRHDLQHAFRRRDFTTMTMHNAKQRSQDEWRDLFTRASPCWKISLNTAYSSHSYRGLWELRVVDE